MRILSGADLDSFQAADILIVNTKDLTSDYFEKLMRIYAAEDIQVIIAYEYRINALMKDTIKTRIDNPLVISSTKYLDGSILPISLY